MARQVPVCPHLACPSPRGHGVPGHWVAFSEGEAGGSSGVPCTATQRLGWQVPVGTTEAKGLVQGRAPRTGPGPHPCSCSSQTQQPRTWRRGGLRASGRPGLGLSPAVPTSSGRPPGCPPVHSTCCCFQPRCPPPALTHRPHQGRSQSPWSRRFYGTTSMDASRLKEL